MANTQKNKQQKLIERRKHRVRSRIQGTTERPRLSVHRSLRYISAQIIDDQTGSTIAASTDRGLKDSEVNAEKGRSKTPHEHLQLEWILLNKHKQRESP